MKIFLKHHKSMNIYYWKKHHECHFVQISKFILIEVVFHKRAYCSFTYKTLLQTTEGVEIN